MEPVALGPCPSTTCLPSDLGRPCKGPAHHRQWDCQPLSSAVQQRHNGLTLTAASSASSRNTARQEGDGAESCGESCLLLAPAACHHCTACATAQHAPLHSMPSIGEQSTPTHPHTQTHVCLAGIQTRLFHAPSPASGPPHCKRVALMVLVCGQLARARTMGRGRAVGQHLLAHPYSAPSW